MQFLTSLFGGSGNTVITAVLALGIVLVLIVLGVWVLKVFFKASTTIGRGRNRRLTVIDSVPLDSRRQLLIVRRDDVEHLILTGGPQDLVVETGIAVDKSARDIRRPPVARATEPTAAARPDRARAEPHLGDEGAGGPSDADPAPAPTVPRTPIDRLRDLGRPAGERKSPSLRHTGLMRPVSRGEPAVIPMNPERPGQTGLDSATSSAANDSNGQSRLGADRYYGDAVKGS